MGINIIKLNELKKLVSLSSRRKHIVVLNPENKEKIETKLNEDIIYDKMEWKLPEDIKIFVKEISKNTKLKDEEKILIIFEKICKTFVYDDNVLSYMQKIDDDSYSVPDWYRRDTNEEWKENREKHNRRVCYEVSRYLAKALDEILENNENMNVCILWDKALTHYLVGLNCDEYNITLDVDDFNNIKDLTRIKAGLTVKGIVVLEDKKGKFQIALDKFNQGKNDDAIKKIENDILNKNSNEQSKEDLNKTNEEPDDVMFLKNAIEILKDKYNIDSQGIYEYMKEIVDIKLGPEKRRKVWKKISENSKDDRYTRCLIVDVCNNKYVIDVEEKELHELTSEEQEKDGKYIPYKKLNREWDEFYHGQ